MAVQTAVDLFAGLGGFTEGARLAGVHVLVAANHWDLAVKTHQRNHPDTEHLCQDLQQANFHSYPDFDLLMASPACQGHSIARGRNRPHHDAARSTAWAVVACAEAKRPGYLVVENVPEFASWQLYPEWYRCLEKLGYTLDADILDAADTGVPQHRRRLFLVGVHRERSTAPVKITRPMEEHQPIGQHLDLEAGSWTEVLRPGRATRTIQRWKAGRLSLGEQFLMAYYGSGSGQTGRSLDRPLGTVTTRDRWAVVKGERMRMLSTEENRLAMGFPATYHLPDSHKVALHMLGNAVCPPVAVHVIGCVQRHAGCR